MQPILFTMILRHPDADTQALFEIKEKDLPSLALGASPVRTITILPADFRHEAQDDPSEIEAMATQCVFCTAVEGGYKLEYIGADKTPKWADELIRALDCSERAERAKRRAETQRMNEARERARPVVLDHRRDAELFRLDGRARLVA